MCNVKFAPTFINCNFLTLESRSCMSTEDPMDQTTHVVYCFLISTGSPLSRKPRLVTSGMFLTTSIAFLVSFYHHFSLCSSLTATRCPRGIFSVAEIPATQWEKEKRYQRVKVAWADVTGC